MGFLIGALKVIILIGSLIIIHEFGHFIVAKLFNIRVLKFSIGFGPKLINVNGKETEFSLRLIPLGGFVQLEGEEAGTSTDSRAFSNKPIWQRILVLLAGVTMNLLLALFIYLCIYMSINKYIIPEISGNNSKEILAQYNLSSGDRILKINGTKIYSTDDIYEIINNYSGDNFLFLVENNNKAKELKNIKISAKEIGFVGLVFNKKIIHDIVSNQAGEEAGLKLNDELYSINDEVYDNIDDYLDIFQNNYNKELDLVVIRNGEKVALKITPSSKMIRDFNVEFTYVEDLPFFSNLKQALLETKSYLRLNIKGFSQLLSGNTQNVEVQGIVGASRQISNTESLVEFFLLMSGISISLAVMNIIPIPGLDGGKILILLIGAVRGKPVSKESEAIVTLIGFAFLLGFVILITVQDISKLF